MSCDELLVNEAIEVSFDSLIQDIELVALQMKSEGEYRYCEKIVTTDSFIYAIMSKESGHDLFIFNNSGCFIKKIVYSDKYPFRFNMKLNHDRSELLVLSELKMLNRHALNGELISKIQLPVASIDIVDYTPANYLIFDGYFQKASNYSVFDVDLNSNETEKEYVWKESKKWHQSIKGDVYATLDTLKNVYILPPNKDTIFLFDKSNKSLLAYKYLNFDGLFLTPDKYPENGFSDKDFAEIMASKRYVYSVKDFHLLRNKLFFRTKGSIESSFFIDFIDQKLYKYDSGWQNIPTIVYAGSDSESYQYYIIKNQYIPDFEKSIGRPLIKNINQKFDLKQNTFLLIKLKLI